MPKEVKVIPITKSSWTDRGSNQYGQTEYPPLPAGTIWKFCYLKTHSHVIPNIIQQFSRCSLRYSQEASPGIYIEDHFKTPQGTDPGFFLETAGVHPELLSGVLPEILLGIRESCSPGKKSLDEFLEETLKTFLVKTLDKFMEVFLMEVLWSF